MKIARNTSSVLAAALVCCASSVVNAADTTATGSASYRVLVPLAITEVTQLNFGKIDRPAGGSQDFIVSPSGGTSIANNGGTGTGGAFIGGHSAGSFSVTGTDGEIVTILKTTGRPCSNRTVELRDVTYSSSSPPLASTQFRLPATIPIGGVLAVSNLSTPGQVTCQYALTASYQ